MNFLREFKYSAISMVSTMDGMFWTVLYPLILASLFFVIFSASFQFTEKNIPVGAAEKNPYNGIFEMTGILEVIPMEESEALDALRTKRIRAFIHDDLSLTLTESGIAQTVVKSVTDMILQTYTLGVPIDPADFDTPYVESRNQKRNVEIILFYSLLAMVSIYSMFGGVFIPVRVQANISKLAVRIAAAPVKRFAFYLPGMLFYILFNLASNILYIGFVMFVLRIPLITDIPVSLLLLGYANMFGIVYGVCIGSVAAWEPQTKTMICVFSSLVLSFLSGMMGPGIKSGIDTYLPILQSINPLGMLTDNFYNVNVLQEYSRIPAFFMLYTVLIALCAAFAFWNSKEVQYDSL